jgi:osmotically-inducible protein OsmY
MKRQILTLLFFGSLAFGDDQKIVNDLANRLGELDLGSHNVSIESRFGNVLLKGTVGSELAKEKIEEVARGFPGVQKLNSELRVVEGERMSCPNLPELQGKGEVKVYCEGDTVEVTGSVSTEREKQRIIQSVSAQMPSKKLINTVKILRPESDEAIFSALSLALKQEGHNLSGITYRVRDGVAVFQGEVSNHRIIDAILATALMVDGVKDIRSEVKVK